MRQNQVKQVTYGAMMLALVGMVLLINTLSAGVLLAMLSFLVPIPYVFYARQFDLKASIVLLFSTLILGIIIAPFDQVILAVMYGIIGVIYGTLVKKGFNDKLLVFIAMLGVLVVYFVTMILFGAIYGYDIPLMITETIDMAKGMLGAQASQLDDNIFGFVVMISIVLQSLLEAVVIHLVSLIMFIYMKMPVPQKVKLRDIEYPMILGIISSLLFLLMMYVNKNNLFSDYQMIISFLGSLGYAYLAYLGLLFFYKSKRFSRWKVFSIIMFIFTFGMYSPLHIGLGLYTSVSGFWRNHNE